MSTFSQFAGNAIKSIQRGSGNFSSLTGGTITISSVNTAKTELRLLGVTTDSNTNVSAGGLTLVLTNSTTITYYRATGSSASTYFSWELTEYY